MTAALAALAALLTLAATWALAALALDRRGRRPIPAGPWAAIVVAGCKVRPDGTAGPSLRRRVEGAVALWRAGVAPTLVLTGGAVRGSPRPEADAAADVARALGVPDAALGLERRSATTIGNAREAAALLGAVPVVVVTDTWHTTRCAWLFARHFPRVAAHGVVGTPRGRAKGALIEVGAVLKLATRPADATSR